jgi:hypothetical protein
MNTAKELTIHNAIKLGLALYFSVFYYEVFINNQATTCQIAKETLDQAKKDLANVDEDDDDYKDAFSIIKFAAGEFEYVECRS